jgi:serine/threonine protein kinase
VATERRYRLLRPIARGGMGEVFDALALGEGGFERRVALKRVLPELSADPEVRGAFLDEARIASRFHHGNIVQVTDYGTLDGAEFLVMEFVDGVHAGEASRRARLAGQGVPIGIALHVLSEIAHALAYLHENGIVHRDVTPHNVLLSWNGDVKLSDFGIAGAIDPESRSGRAEGKRRYMAPEQARGEPVSGAADVWAAAATLHALIVDAPPEHGEIDPEIPSDVRSLLEPSLRVAPGDRIAAPVLADRAGELASRRLHRNGRGALSEWLKAMRHAGERDRAENALDLFVIPAVSGGSRRFTVTTISPGDAARRPISPVLFESEDVVPRSTVPATPSPAPPPGEVARRGPESEDVVPRSTLPATPSPAPPPGEVARRGPASARAPSPPAPVAPAAVAIGHADTLPSVRPAGSPRERSPESAGDARPSSPRATGPFPAARRSGGRWAIALAIVVAAGAGVAVVARVSQLGATAGRAKEPANKVVLAEREPVAEPPAELPAELPTMVDEPVEIGARRDEEPAMREETARRDPVAMREEPATPEVEAPRATAWLRVGGAGLMQGAVFVDGRAAGHAPVELPIATGPHRVVVRAADGAVLLDRTVTLGPEHTRANALRLVR